LRTAIAALLQDNVHHSALTVRQTLSFAARLRMPSSATARDRDGRIASMVAMLGLDGERHSAASSDRTKRTEPNRTEPTLYFSPPP
ncbi:unnamed protein product, partial [Laminaria digitata]